MLARASRVLLASVWLAASLSAANAAQIISWGSDSSGQVSNTPSGTGFTAIAAGGSHNLALAADASIVAWGLDSHGQVSGTPSGTGFDAIAAGSGHSLALAAGGSIVAWGWDGAGQVSGTPLGTGHTAVAAGYEHSHAINANGILVWGYPIYFQGCFPNGTYLAVDGGVSHSVALTANGSIVSCGDNLSGQVSGTPSGTGFTAIAAGDFHSLALAADGSIVAWGANNHGQVSGTPSGIGFTAIAAGGSHNLALAANGSIVAWGANNDGQVSGTPSGFGFTAIAAGFGHSLALQGQGGSPGCPPSINCPAPEPSDPLSVARLVLFPGTGSVVRDNDPSKDLDLQCGVISVNDVPFPDDPLASFSGTLYLDPPTSSTQGELVATDATIANNGAAALIRGDIPFACAEFYVTGPSPVPGSLAVQIGGTVETADGTATTAGGEELEITGVGRTLSVPSEPGTPPAEVLASWVSSGPAPSPAPMSASASKSGTYAIGPGIIGLKMNINLPVREVMQLPTSVAATVPEPGTIAQRASGALALALLYRFRRSRRLPSRPATRQSARVDEGLREPEAGVG